MSLRLFRRRLIPDECIPLTGDRILYADDRRIVTAWKAIRQRADLARGYSCYYLDRGFKISRFYDHEDRFIYWYCDIIRTVMMPEEGCICFKDLLADVIVDIDGSVRVLDLDELADAMEQGLLEPDEPAMCLRQLNDLLSVCAQKGFDELTAFLLAREREDRQSAND